MDMGSSGKSTAPHLHYGFIKMEKNNPAYYFHNDLSPDEFDRMLELFSRKSIFRLMPYKKTIENYISIGEVAKILNVNVSLIRFWKRI